MTKEEKAEYDKTYRLKNKEILSLKHKQYYQKNQKEIYAKQRERRNNDEARLKHALYCRSPEQREKERKRRHIRENKTSLKKCLNCKEEKQIIDFEHWPIAKDKRHYLCKECEKNHQKELGCSTRGVLTAMVGRRYSNLTRSDLIEHPYLIEANKYLILLKKITK